MTNTKLLGVLVFLLTFTFFWEKEYKSFQIEKKLVEKSLYPLIPQNIKDLEVGEASFHMRDGSWFFKNTDFKVSDKNLKAWFDSFKDVVLLKENVSQVENFIEDFSLVLGSERWSFSPPNKISGNFFIKVTKGIERKIYLVYSDKAFDGFYRNEEDLKKKAYLALKESLLYFQKNLLQKKLFDFELVRVDRRIGSESIIKIDFESFETKPSVYEGLNYDNQYFNLYKKKLENLFIEDVISNLGGEKWGRIAFKGHEKETSYEIFSKNEVYYLKEKNYYLKISGEATQLLMNPIYTFWEKKLSWVDSELSVAKKLVIQNKKSDKKVILTITEDKKILAEGIDQEISQGLKELLCYISYCQKSYAYLSLSRERSVPEYPYEVRIGNKKILFDIKGTVISIFDPEFKIKMQYIWSLFKKGNVFEKL